MYESSRRPGNDFVTHNNPGGDPTAPLSLLACFKRTAESLIVLPGLLEDDDIPSTPV